MVTTEPLPVFAADPTQLTQVLQNLLSNALKFRGPDTPRVQVSAVRDDGFWHFSMAHNGIGIDPQHSEQVFVIFQRLHREQDFAGTGIGLAICRKIIERHGGRIWVESALGKGSTFHFTLPV